MAKNKEIQRRLDEIARSGDGDSADFSMAILFHKVLYFGFGVVVGALVVLLLQ